MLILMYILVPFPKVDSILKSFLINIIKTELQLFYSICFYVEYFFFRKIIQHYYYTETHFRLKLFLGEILKKKTIHYYIFV